MKKRKKRFPSFVAIARATLLDPNWRKLGPSSKVLYLHLKSKFVGHNNGELCLRYCELKDFMSPPTISDAFKELVEVGWITKDHIVGGKHRFTVYYALTGKYDETISRYGF